MLTLGMHGTKWEIFKNSVDLFSKNGYDNTSMRDIADMTGVKAASLYNHFPSKESILDVMYRFYCENVENTLPSLERILGEVPYKSPKDALISTMCVYDDKLQPFMDKIYMVSILRSSHDLKAADLVWKYNFNNSKKYLRAVLQKMIDLDKIEPLDIECFIELFCGFAFTAVFKQNTDRPLGWDLWQRVLDYLYSTVKEKTT